MKIRRRPCCREYAENLSRMECALDFAIIFVLLIVAFDLTFNNASWLKAIVGYANALMWKIGPI